MKIQIQMMTYLAIIVPKTKFMKILMVLEIIKKIFREEILKNINVKYVLRNLQIIPD